jgi:hypothetical protein
MSLLPSAKQPASSSKGRRCFKIIFDPKCFNLMNEQNENEFKEKKPDFEIEGI